MNTTANTFTNTSMNTNTNTFKATGMAHHEVCLVPPLRTILHLCGEWCRGCALMLEDGEL